MYDIDKVGKSIYKIFHSPQFPKTERPSCYWAYELNRFPCLPKLQRNISSLWTIWLIFFCFQSGCIAVQSTHWQNINMFSFPIFISLCVQLVKILSINTLNINTIIWCSYDSISKPIINKRLFSMETSRLSYK